MRINEIIFNVVKSKDEDKAIIDIDGQIGEYADWSTYSINAENTNKGFKAQLAEIGDVDEITININSLGGSVFHGISIHDILKEHPAKKIVNIKGYTASIATVIAMVGDKINMSSNAMFLIHRAQMFGDGNANDMRAVLKNLETVDNSLIDIYRKRTKIPKDEIIELIDQNNGHGLWINSTEAKRRGFVDEVFEPGKTSKKANVKALLENPMFMNSATPRPELENEVSDDEVIALIKQKLDEEGF